ncbi:sugar ABC transporter ATP-binding protein [Oceanicola granulosus HTCC2516]|uniref:Sugar ABC transporter ATP-binding protein n=1 Tax=Oceanicola granulosus (strain ATCC BAA-861 / DSM 15982 / KCTC 12143 / HTCC2516) TaxID=314256 RepID=Q2CGW0_OCEGH|nr:ATP-binding cassette domain-containing protein [Oceanicola granulosus]EAR51825.1 sugar ABC transporter ATP-binding protein [Oceanicola granulosus HTCC2516]
MAEIVLKMENVSKTYPGVRALDDFSIECRAGEVHAILGENGSGKSTLMKIASGTVTPDGGSVTIDGQPLTAADARLAHQLGLYTVYQDDSLVRELTVAQNLYLGTEKGAVPYARMNAWAQGKLNEYEMPFPATTILGDLTPAHRQFVEIIKGLLNAPRVLLLDEPTSTLDMAGVTKLMAMVRDLTAQGTGVLYVSHRLPEILDLADRVTILRDGVQRGTFPVTPDLSEHELISLMIGRDLEGEYPDKLDAGSATPVLSVRGLDGEQFHDVSFDAYPGEILGLAGAEGNGQREALRAVVGLETATGEVRCHGRRVNHNAPHDAIASDVLFLSSDRVGEAIFPELSVRKNMMLTRLRDVVAGPFVAARREDGEAERMRGDFGVVTASLDSQINGLSGGNQQKAALARTFRSGARAVLIDEPTQGVDAGARFEIYRAIRDNIRDDGTCVVNSSDAQELAGICDRVLVFSRGRIVAELTGADVTEERIVSSFLTTRDAQAARAGDAPALSSFGASMMSLFRGSVNWWVPLVFLSILTLIVGGYAASQSEAFLRPINFRHILLAVAPAAMVAMAQLHVLLVRGLDVSVGSMMSLTVVAASFLIAFQSGTGTILLGIGLCLLIGLAAGTVNGMLVRYARINAIITTIAMLSILQGLALVFRPTPGGLISQDFTEFLRARVGFLPVSVFFLIAFALLSDLWLHRTRSGLEAKAVGFREEAARRNGVAVDRVQIRAYVLAALTATVAGFFLASEVGVGHPTIGANFALASIAAAVLGGASLGGGRGSFGGALFGAFFFTLTINVISILGLSASVGVIASGAMTLLAVFLYTGFSELEKLLAAGRRRRAFRRMAGLQGGEAW